VERRRTGNAERFARAHAQPGTGVRRRSGPDNASPARAGIERSCPPGYFTRRMRAPSEMSLSSMRS
jgi:hypothetical protein